MKLKDAKILCFDMETPPLKFWGWDTGKQYVGHKQLVKGSDRFGIICITYCWVNDNKPAQCIDWGYEEQNTSKVVEEFDKILKTADHVIGKNNKRFDNKMLNAARMFSNLPALPDWCRYTDDLETHMRKYFRMPSYSLDYISNQLGLGGKMKMEMQDWIDIVDKTSNGEKSLAKMIKYGKKDVVDTRTIWNKISQHFEPRFNEATFHDIKHGCKQCGSLAVVKDGVVVGGNIKYQRYECKDCGRYAGRTLYGQEEGKIR